MIPKTIHYCWFGRNPLPKLAKKCIRSWKRYCRGYEIIEWNEDNFDISAAPLYVRQAYEAKKWAFVTDYVRLYAMVNYGGIYMDTDVEVVKPLDQFLSHQAFSGFEDATNIPTGIMACEKGFPLFDQLLHYYDDIPFLKPDGSCDLTTNVLIITDLCVKKGLLQNNSFQVVEGFALYPNDVFCPRNLSTGEVERTENTATIHWFSASWQPRKAWVDREKNYVRRRRKMRKKCLRECIRKLLGERFYLLLRDLKNKLRGR